MRTIIFFIFSPYSTTKTAFILISKKSQAIRKIGSNDPIFQLNKLKWNKEQSSVLSILISFYYDIKELLKDFLVFKVDCIYSFTLKYLIETFVD